MLDQAVDPVAQIRRIRLVTMVRRVGLVTMNSRIHMTAWIAMLNQAVDPMPQIRGIRLMPMNIRIRTMMIRRIRVMMNIGIWRGEMGRVYPASAIRWRWWRVNLRGIKPTTGRILRLCETRGMNHRKNGQNDENLRKSFHFRNIPDE